MIFFELIIDAISVTFRDQLKEGVGASEKTVSRKFVMKSVLAPWSPYGNSSEKNRSSEAFRCFVATARGSIIETPASIYSEYLRQIHVVILSDRWNVLFQRFEMNL